MTSTSAAEFLAESAAPGVTDDGIFARLEADFGDGLQAALGRYLETCDALCLRLEEVMSYAYWQEAARIALKIGHEANALGFHHIAAAARKLADAAYRADNALALRNDAQTVLLEYGRFRLALMARYPAFMARF
jgi:hypothetical protein